MFTERERYLMEAAMSAGDCYADLDMWLAEILTDDGATIGMLLKFDADNRDKKLKND